MKTHSASLRPKTANEQDRTIEVVFSTGADVTRGAPELGRYIERLEVSNEALDTSRIIGGPVLNTHRRGSLADVIGQVLAVRIEAGLAIALVRIDQDEIWARVSAGTIRAVSAGYEVIETAETEEGGMPVRTATKWRPLEISFVPIGADAGAQIRARKDIPMPDTQIQTQEPITRPATVTQLRTIANIAALGDDWIDDQADAGASIEMARAAAMESLESQTSPIRTTQKRQTASTILMADHEAPEVVLPLMGEALFARSNPGYELSEAARPFYGMSMVEIARETLQRRGHSHRSMAATEVVTRSLHTTSDFGIILGDSVGRSIRAAYQSAPSSIKQTARQTTARDFRAKHRIMLGEGPELLPVSEHGEYRSGTIAEAEETYSISTFGRIFGITRRVIVNDDLGAFTDLSSRMGIAAADFEVQQLVSLLESNPVMKDGNALFHTDHKNLAATGGTVSEGSLGDGRLAMRQQTGLSGTRINVVPEHLVVPAELETVAEKQLSAIQAHNVSDVNPFSVLKLVVESRLTDPDAWYLQAANVDGLEYAYLEGAPGPQIDSRNGFEIDGVQIKVRLDFGAGFVDHRSWYKNEGPA